jgi:hypothetical protein
MIAAHRGQTSRRGGPGLTTGESSLTNSLLADYRPGLTVSPCDPSSAVATDSPSHRATLSAVHMPRLRSHRSTAHRAIGAAVAVSASVMLLGACGDDGGSRAERFCGEIAEHKEALTAPVLEFSDDIEPLLELYRDIGDVAPLSIEQEWNQLVSAYETASTVVVDDPASQQAAASAIYSSEASAAKVDTWLRANCAVEIGPVVTLVPHP